MAFRVKNTTIYLTRGDTFKALITITNPDGTIYTPQEGDEIRFAMKQDVEDEECLIIRDIPKESMLLILYPEDTKHLEYGTYVYDIQLTKANGDVDTFITASKLKLTYEVE